MFEDLAKEYAGRAVVLKIDFDKETELTDKYDVSGLPTVVFLKDGKVHGEKIIGVMERSDYKARLDEMLK
ncbi:MAG TPA: hypothetical protein EYN70_00370 [Planctomycetaceae bacterium]|nr:hypothetical protein [Planctomycetaceae bacterium]